MEMVLNDSDLLLDYIELQIFPTQNRYEACECSRNKVQKVTSGTLEQLLLHSTRVKDLSSKGSNTNFKILPPENVNDAEWFTTATLTRFLHIIGSPEILSIGNEITQLEETRKFQLSLSMKAEVDITSSVDSKNELLRAVDMRLTALKDELVAAFDHATGHRCSTKDISDLENFAHHVGAKDIRDSLQKFVEMSLFPTVENLGDGDFKKIERTAPSPQPSQMNPTVKYIVSPAKVAQAEEDSIDDENSSFSSENDKPPVERSRAPTRSATPRRSASPMRRIQIGRSGSHRAAALTIKSLNYHPAREKLGFQRDLAGNSSDEEDEDQEKPVQKNVLRMSVQDKISLFENKQRDQKMDILKTKRLLNTTVGPNKAVLRRWSSGMGERAMEHVPNTNTEPSLIRPKIVTPEPESDSFVFENRVSAETVENIKPHSPVAGATESEREESYENHPNSIEWSQQKEAELNELFMNMMENKNKFLRNRNSANDICKGKKSPVQKNESGGLYDHYKQKRDEKLHEEASGKKAEKEAQFKVTQQFADEKKPEMTSTKSQKKQKNMTPLMNSRKESSKPSVLKKTTSKTSPLPTTRKSWSSTPSPRTPTGPTMASTTPRSRKPVGSNTKSEKSQPQSKTLKTSPPDSNKCLKAINGNKQPTVTNKTRKPTKPNVESPEVKPSFYNKVTKKSSVVPLETKPFLRKGSGVRPGVSPAVTKIKVVDHPEETSIGSGTLIQTEDNEVVITTDIDENHEECEPQLINLSPTECEELMSPKRVDLLEIKYENEEEKMISPTAWVEEEEEEEDRADNQEEDIIPCLLQTISPVKVVAPATASSSPRVRHSLSQMLLEDSSEEADIGEWGNADHPPALVYQKDSPKGFKRLLKFARKSKQDLSFLEGDDDAEESKGQSNISKFTSQNHPKVRVGQVSASMNSIKGTRPFFSLSAFRGSKTNESKLP